MIVSLSLKIQLTISFHYGGKIENFEILMAVTVDWMGDGLVGRVDKRIVSQFLAEN